MSDSNVNDMDRELQAIIERGFDQNKYQAFADWVVKYKNELDARRESLILEEYIMDIIITKFNPEDRYNCFKAVEAKEVEFYREDVERLYNSLKNGNAYSTRDDDLKYLKGELSHNPPEGSNEMEGTGSQGEQPSLNEREEGETTMTAELPTFKPDDTAKKIALDLLELDKRTPEELLAHIMDPKSGIDETKREAVIMYLINYDCPITEEMIDGLEIDQEDKDSLKTSLKEVQAQQNASPPQVDVSTSRPAAASNPEGKIKTVSDPTKIFDKPQNPLTIIENLRNASIKNEFFGDGRAKKAILVQEGDKTQEIHPILFWEIYARLKDANGQEYASLEERNTLIKEFLKNGTSVLSSVKGHELDVYKVFAKSVLKGVKSDSLGELEASHNYKGLGLVSHHVLKQELAKQPPNKAYVTEVMKALAQVPEAGFEDIQLSKELLDKLKTDHPALLDELRKDPQVEAFLQRHEKKVEVITDEKPLPYDTIKKRNDETPETWFARVAQEHDKVANGNENSKHHAISLAYGEIAKLYKELNGKTGAERKAILTRLANALSKVNASNSPYHELLITPETGGSTGKLSEAQMLLGYQGAVAEEMSKMQPKRIIKDPPQPFPVPTTQPKIDTEELERKKKALDAMAAARHDGAQEKTWWQRNKEWIYWLIGILVVSALGVFAFRKGGWFNKDKKSSSVAVTPNTNTNSNTNTNTNTGGGLADNSTLYKADEVCDALAGNSRVPPTFSNNGR